MSSNAKFKLLEGALLLALAVAAVFRWVHLVEHIRNYYVDLPTWDYWRVVQNLAAYRAGDLKVFWLQHNEHRIVLPEIVFALDMLWCQGRKILPTAVGLACYAGTLLLLSAALFRDEALTFSTKLAGFLLAAITLGWMGSAVVIGDPFLLQWTLLHILLVSSLTLLSLAQSRASKPLLVASILCAAGATYTSGNGMLLWAVLVAAALLLQVDKWWVEWILVGASVSVGCYFIGYKSTGHLNIGQFLRSLGHSVGFFTSYLAMPFAANRSRAFGVAAGLLNVGLFAVLIWRAARKGLLRTRPAIVLFGVFVFTLLSAVLAAAGRMDLADRTFVLAKQARYVTTPLVNWGALLLACVWLSSREREPSWLRWRVPGVCALALFFGFRHLSPWVQARDAEVADLQLAALAVQSDILDDAILNKIFPDPAFVRSLLPELRAHRLSIYSEEETGWLGIPLPAVSRSGLASQRGALSYELALPSGKEVGLTLEQKPEWLVFADEALTIVGIGRRLPAGIPFALQSQMRGEQAAFGFVNAKLAKTRWRAYLVREGDHALGPIEGVGNPVH